MKKHLIYMFAGLLALGCASCGEDDPVIPRDREVTMRLNTISHIVDTQNSTMSVASGSTVVVLSGDRTTCNATLSTAGLDNVSVSGATLTGIEDHAGRYHMSGGTSTAANFTGLLDMNEQAIFANYTIGGRYRVMTTLPEVYYTQARSELTYSDGTSYTQNLGGMYQIDIDPATMTATLHIMQLHNGKESHYYTSIIARGIPVTLLANGYRLNAAMVSAEVNHTVNNQLVIDTDNYHIANINFTADIAEGTMSANYTLRRVLTRDEYQAPLTFNDINVVAIGSNY